MNDKEYFADKTAVSNSMLHDYVTYDKYNNRLVTIDYYIAKHIDNINLDGEGSDAMMIGTICDKYISEGEKVLDDYPVVSRRSGANPNEITGAMKEKVDTIIRSINAFRSLQELVNDPVCEKQATLKKEIELPNGKKLVLKGKLDLLIPGKIISDVKTTANINTLWESLQFKGTPNINARYFRQLAIYRFLEGNNLPCSITSVDHEGRMFNIPVRSDILDKTWTNILYDLMELQELYESNFEYITVDPFKEFNEEDMIEDTL